MMYEPMRRNGMFSDILEDMFGGPAIQPGYSFMNTDIHKKDGDYILDIDLAGYKKEEIQISLDKGNLIVKASKNETKEEKDEKGKLLRQERFSGETSRSYYVGNGVSEKDVKASYKDGVLTIVVPSEEKKQIEETKYIGIE